VPALVAGCSGLDGTSSPDATETGTGTASPTRAPPIDCAAAQRPPPEADAADEVEPRTYPGPPDGDPLDWAIAHERAYRVNALLRDLTVREVMGPSIQDSAVEPHGPGTVVRLAYTYGMRVDQGVADSSVLQVGYYIDDRGARRRLPDERVPLSSVDPVANGEPVVCF